MIAASSANANYSTWTYVDALHNRIFQHTLQQQILLKKTHTTIIWKKISAPVK